MKSKNIVKKRGLSLVFALVVMLVMVYVVAPFAQRQLLKFGADTQIRKDSRCESYKKQYVEIMMKKEKINDFLDTAKQDKCLK